MKPSDVLAKKAETVVAALRASRCWLATAESCTGGLVSASLTSVSGASDVFGYGFVTYANPAKVNMISVPQLLIDRCGAVSAEVAEAMAVGALKTAEADIALAITGIAGPNGGTPEKPVGLVFIAIAQKSEQIYVSQNNFDGDRDAIRIAAATAALTGVLAALDDPTHSRRR